MEGLQTCQPPKGKQCESLLSEPELGTVVRKGEKSRDMSQISYWKGFQWRLWVLEVTCHLNAGALDNTISFTSYVL